MKVSASTTVAPRGMMRALGSVNLARSGATSFNICSRNYPYYGK